MHPYKQSGRRQNVLIVLRLWRFLPLRWSEVKWSEVKWSERSEVKWNVMKLSAVQAGEEKVFMEKIYRSSKWWELKDWGESVSELMIVKKKHNYKKLYTVLYCLGICTFCTCCKILICLVCFVASFKLSFV